MELRGISSQQQKDMRIPTTTSTGGGYGLQHPSSRLGQGHHQESPPSSLAADRRRNNDLIQSQNHPMQTLDQLHLTQQYQQDELPANPDPDPPLLPIAPSNNVAAEPPQARSANGSANLVRYKACLKNHAASMGGHVIDGCGEFMPSGEEGTPDALKCAACNCHRNFHRKEIDGEAPPPPSYFPFTPAMNNNNNNNNHRVHTPTPTPHSAPAMHPHQLHHYSHGLVPSVMMAFGGNGGGIPAESSSEDLNMFNHARGQVLLNPSSFSLSRKRFRTKFTQKQKDSMHEFAEKLGWKIQKQDEQQVLQFCNEVGVKRQVFKVWMHNNKQNLKKRQM